MSKKNDILEKYVKLNTKKEGGFIKLVDGDFSPTTKYAEYMCKLWLSKAPFQTFTVKQIIQTVNDLCRKSGLTVLLVEQNANSALAVADYGVLLSLGKVVANLPAAELKADASLRAAYLGY